MDFKVIRGRLRTFINARIDNVSVSEITIVRMALESQIKNYEKDLEECQKYNDGKSIGYYQEKIKEINEVLQNFDMKSEEITYVDACYFEDDEIPEYDELLRKHKKLSKEETRSVG